MEGPQVTLASLPPGLAIKKFSEIPWKVGHLKLIPEGFFPTGWEEILCLGGGGMASLHFPGFLPRVQAKLTSYRKRKHFSCLHTRKSPTEHGT